MEQIMSNTLLETIQTLRQRAEHLEKEAGLLQQELARVADALTSPSSVVAHYVVEGESYQITQADVDAVRAELAKPWTESALYELAVVKKVAKRLRTLSPEVQDQRFFKTVEAIRAAALADGTAIESETDAVIDD